MTTTKWAHRVEDETKLHATEHNEPWANDDLEFVIEMTDVESDEAIAIALGRTLYSIWAITHRVRSGDLTMEHVRAKRERETKRVVAICSAHFVELLPTGECPMEA